jgi:hypothetical protein
VLWPGRIWIIELKTEAASHRDDQPPYYLSLAAAAGPPPDKCLRHDHGWEGRPPAGEHVVVVSHRPKPDGWHPEASYHFVDDVAAVTKAKLLAGKGTVAVAAGNVGGQALALGLPHRQRVDNLPWICPEPVASRHARRRTPTTVAMQHGAGVGKTRPRGRRTHVSKTQGAALRSAGVRPATGPPIAACSTCACPNHTPVVLTRHRPTG